MFHWVANTPLQMLQNSVKDLNKWDRGTKWVLMT